MLPTSPETLTAELKLQAKRLGFHLVGACPAVSLPGMDRFLGWLAAGYMGEMRYLSDRADAYRDVRCVLDGARSLLMLGIDYHSAEPGPIQSGEGRISRYAWGVDYHEVVRSKLRALAEVHRRLCPGAEVRGVVDTAPLLEREYAQLAGLGWIGKNTLLLNREHGSWFFLAALLTTEVLGYDEPAGYDTCGACRACLDACPTGALVAPRVLDARRCISYLTIELRGPVPPELREGVGDRLFGCDVCQEVCPWNRHRTARGEAVFGPNLGNDPVDLAALFALDDAAFRERFRATPLWRAKRRGILRNAAIVLGNRPHEAAIGALVRGLHDGEPLVRGACAWALGRQRSGEAAAALRARLVEEPDPVVRGEIEAAISETAFTRIRSGSAE